MLRIDREFYHENSLSIESVYNENWQVSCLTWEFIKNVPREFSTNSQHSLSSRMSHMRIDRECLPWEFSINSQHSLSILMWDMWLDILLISVKSHVSRSFRNVSHCEKQSLEVPFIWILRLCVLQSTSRMRDLLYVSHFRKQSLEVALFRILLLFESFHFHTGCMRTGWRRLMGSPKLQIVFHNRGTKYRSLLQKMTYTDKGSHESSPPCTAANA